MCMYLSVFCLPAYILSILCSVVSLCVTTCLPPMSFNVVPVLSGVNVVQSVLKID